MGASLTLVLGGARSGKSAYAERVLAQDNRPVLYVATATAGDDEMAARIAAHRANRPANWLTLEAPIRVGKEIQKTAFQGDVLLDCLTLLACNVLMACTEPLAESCYQRAMQTELDELLSAYQNHAGNWLVVSNEVGLGLVPSSPIGRMYRDELGRSNQRLAAAADHVIFMTAGLALKIK